MKAGECKAMRDWTCTVVRQCTDSAEGSRMVLCSEGAAASVWGWAFVGTLAVAAAAYGAGGVYYGAKTRGVAAGVGAHPHMQEWMQIAGLVTDGAAFALGKRGGASGLAEPLGAADAGPARLPAQVGEKGKGKSDEEERGSGSDDDIIE